MAKRESPTKKAQVNVTRCAILRAGGLKWETIAQQTGLSLNTITKYPQCYADLWTHAYTEAVSEVMDAAYAEAMHVARGLLRDANLALRQKAADSIMRHRAAMRPLRHELTGAEGGAVVIRVTLPDADEGGGA